MSRLKRIQERGYDYEIEHLPMKQRKSTASLTAIWLGFAVQFATIMVGGIIGSGLSLGKAVVAIMIGNIILAAISVSTGLIGRRVGLGFSMLTRYPFGNTGSFIPSICCGIVQLGWLTFCYWIFAIAVQQLFVLVNPSLGSLGFYVGIVAATVMTAIPVSMGYEGPAWVAWVSIPLYLIPMFYVLFALAVKAGGFGYIVANYEPSHPLSLVHAVTLVIGAWLFGAMTAPDFIRFGKSDLAAWVTPPVGLIVGEGLVLFLGALTAAVTNGATWNPVEAAAKVGTLASIAVIILYIGAMWATNVPTAYSSSMQFANALKKPKTVFALIMSFIAPLLAILIQNSVGALVAIDAFIKFLSTVLPPVGGILVAEYWIVKSRNLPVFTDNLRAVNPVAYTVWILAALFNHWTVILYNEIGASAGFQYGIPGLNGFVAGIVLYAVLNSLAISSGVNWSKYNPENVKHKSFFDL